MLVHDWWWHFFSYPRAPCPCIFGTSLGTWNTGNRHLGSEPGLCRCLYGSKSDINTLIFWNMMNYQIYQHTMITIHQHNRWYHMHQPMKLMFLWWSFNSIVWSSHEWKGHWHWNAKKSGVQVPHPPSGRCCSAGFSSCCHDCMCCWARISRPISSHSSSWDDLGLWAMGGQSQHGDDEPFDFSDYFGWLPIMSDLSRNK